MKLVDYYFLLKLVDVDEVMSDDVHVRRKNAIVTVDCDEIMYGTLWYHRESARTLDVGRPFRPAKFFFFFCFLGAEFSRRNSHTPKRVELVRATNPSLRERVGR